MARNLLKLGQGVVVWNRSADKCGPLVAEGCVAVATPAEVVARCDLTFAMLSDPEVAAAVALGPDGVLAGITAGKGYIDMSTGAGCRPAFASCGAESRPCCSVAPLNLTLPSPCAPSGR